MSPGRAPQMVSIETSRQILERAGLPSAWNVTPEQFKAALERSASRRFGEGAADQRAVESYLGSLHALDLALACACAAGNAAAWDRFVAQFRPELYRAARAIAGESTGRELADSLYAELYGLRETKGVRHSLFNYYHGRSKLSTWLRAILSQRHVDEIRRSRRTESLDDGEGDSVAEKLPAAKSAAGDLFDLERKKYLVILQTTLTAVLGGLESRDRLRLAYYYVEELTLAEIGKLLGEHEATVSRKLDRTRKELRSRIDAALREKKLSDAQLQLCYEYAQQEWPFDLTLALKPMRAAPVDSGPQPST
jgi:RNA polymerase sigma-70 factor, ECF subfamily